jgi:hypothetical protein
LNEFLPSSRERVSALVRPEIMTRPGIPSIVAARSARIVVALLALGLTAGVVPTRKPEDVGLASDRLRSRWSAMEKVRDSFSTEWAFRSGDPGLGVLFA